MLSTDSTFGHYSRSIILKYIKGLDEKALSMIELSD